LSVNRRIRKNAYGKRTAVRREKARRRFLNALGIAGGVLGIGVMSFLFIFIHDLLMQCDYFRAEQIEVKGIRRLSRQEVLRQANIEAGMNILSVNLDTARKRLLSHHWVAEAEVSRELPSGIRIRITEHTPLAVVELGRRFLLNTRGEIFKEWKPSDPEGIPVIGGLEFSDFAEQVGRAKSLPYLAVMHVLEMGGDPGGVLPNASIRRIEVDREMGLTLTAIDREKVTSVKLGYHDYPQKFEKLGNVLHHAEKGVGFPDFDVIDLNNLKRIVVNPVREAAPARGQKEV
jgi:cell division protein FtsQ